MATLLHRWEMRDNILDSVGSAHLRLFDANGNVVPVYASGPRYRSGVLEAGQMLSAFDPAQGNINTQDFSITFWFRLVSASSSFTFLGKRPGGTGTGWALFCSGDFQTIQIRLDDESTPLNHSLGQTPARFDDNQWHHLAIRVDRDGNIDGRFDNVALPSTPAASAPLTLYNAAEHICLSGFNETLSTAVANISFCDVQVFDGLLLDGELDTIYADTTGFQRYTTVRHPGVDGREYHARALPIPSTDAWSDAIRSEVKELRADGSRVYEMRIPYGETYGIYEGTPDNGNRLKATSASVYDGFRAFRSI